MIARYIIKMIVTLTCFAPYFLVFGQCDIPRPITSEYLRSLKAIPEHIEVTHEGDECYRQIVSLGLPVAQELIDLLNDPILSEHLVPHWGGQYAVGDIALYILMDIMHIPVVDLLPAVDQNDYKVCGFCVYWQYVRQGPENRMAFRSIVEKWFNNNRDSLYWKDIPGIPTGGQYRLKAKYDA